MKSALKSVKNHIGTDPERRSRPGPVRRRQAMNISVLPVGALQTNCYIIGTDRGNALVIDPGANAEGIVEFLTREGLTLRFLVYTHGHFDHIGATTRLREITGARTVLPKEDLDIFLDPTLTGSGLFSSYRGYTPVRPDLLYEQGSAVELDEVRLFAMHTPGHTKGSSILIGDGVIFTGDTLFAGSCGRTDLYGGSEEELAASLKRIAALEGDYQLLPGHGPQSTLSAERITNPFLGTNYDDIF